jgi:hypothetical protein
VDISGTPPFQWLLQQACEGLLTAWASRNIRLLTQQLLPKERKWNLLKSRPGQALGYFHCSDR